MTSTRWAIRDCTRCESVQCGSCPKFQALKTTSAKVGLASRDTGRGAASDGGAAGLVPFKTSRKDLPGDGFAVRTDKETQALLRVKRLKRSVWASGHLHGIAQDGFRAHQAHFVTLTYVGVNDWQPKHIAKALESYRNWCKGRGLPCRYTWVAELQTRGAVHYHLLCWLPQGVRMPKWDRPTKSPKLGKHRPPFWPHGMTNTQPAKSGVGYLMKYLSKLGELTVFPKGLRLYGIGGLDDKAKSVRQWFNLPQWAKNEYGVGELVRKAGAVIVRATGEILPPAFRLVRRDGWLEIFKLRQTAERWADGAYSRVSFAGVLSGQG